MLMVGVGFGQEYFAGSKLGDERRTKRLIRVADSIMAHPNGSLPDKIDDPAGLKALYRLMDTPEVTHASVLACPMALVRAQMRACSGVVLLLHDSTELNFTSRYSLEDLGPIGRGKGRGYLCHNTLAVEAKGKRTLGLAYQRLHTRVAKRKGETRRSRRLREDRESLLWQLGCEAVGMPTGDALWVDVADRGADIFEFLEYELSQGRHFVVRCKYDRKLGGEGGVGKEGKALHLHEHLRQLPSLGKRIVEIKGGTGVKAREAQVRVAAGPVELLAPAHPRGLHGSSPLKLWGVHVVEEHPPEGVAPLEWMLLTNLPCDTFEDACERVDYYHARWVIEEYHKCQKTGCAIELPQFTEMSRLEPMIALLSVVAAQLLKLRDAARREDLAETPARSLMPVSYVEVLSGWRWGDVDRAVSVREFMLALARLGGHQNRKSDGLPGWITLWRGWTKLLLMVKGAAAIRRRRCGQT